MSAIAFSHPALRCRTLRSWWRRRVGSVEDRRRTAHGARPKRLALISDLPHYLVGGQLHGATPMVAQLARWAAPFDELVVCSPLLEGPLPAGFSPFPIPVRFEPVRAGGGNTLGAKVRLIARVPGWAWRTRRVARCVDAVVLRCPSNVAAVALLSTWRAVRFRAAIYAAAWEDYRGEPRPYRLQRNLLASGVLGVPVLVYAASPGRRWLEPSFSPSHDRATWEQAEAVAVARLERILGAPPDRTWVLVAVGRLTPNKNQRVAVDAVALLVDRGIDARLEVVGSGPQAGALRVRAREAGIADRVAFLGELEHAQVLERFAAADLQLLPTRHEGFGKVLLEGMVGGLVPILGASPAAMEVAGDGRRGVVVDSSSAETFADAVAALVADRSRWHAMSGEARAYAGQRTLESYEVLVREVLERQWGVSLRGEGREGQV